MLCLDLVGAGFSPGQFKREIKTTSLKRRGCQNEKIATNIGNLYEKEIYEIDFVECERHQGGA